MQKKKVAVLISGGGTNLQALIDACASPSYPAEIVLVLSNKADAYGLKRAEQSGIATCVINHKNFSTREEFDRNMQQEILKSGAEIVCLAGFMRLVTPWFVNQWQGRMINIHPSLLPSFKGINAQQQALEYGVKITGCTVHFVVPEMDSGPIILQAAVNIEKGETVDSLTKKILEKEHAIYPEALKMLANGIKA